MILRNLEGNSGGMSGFPKDREYCNFEMAMVFRGNSEKKKLF